MFSHSLLKIFPRIILNLRINRLKLLTIMLALFLSPYAFSYDAVKFASFQGYENEGSFVEYSAYAGDNVGFLITGYPAAIITEPIRLIVPNSKYSDIIGYYIVAGGTKGFGCAFGAIPYGLKKLFHDIWVPKETIKKEKPQATAVKIPQQLLEPDDEHIEFLDKTVSGKEVPEGEEPEILHPEMPEEKEEKLPQLENLPEPGQTLTMPAKTTETEEEHDKQTSPKASSTSKPSVKVSSDLPSWVKQEIEEKN